MDMSYMFNNFGGGKSGSPTALNGVPIVSKWNTGNVTNMSGMFNGYGNTSKNISCVLDLSEWYLSKITGTNGNDVFNFNPETLGVKFSSKTGENDNEANNWYYGDEINFITPPTGKIFIPTSSN